jgi:hypothetical protein
VDIDVISDFSDIVSKNEIYISLKDTVACEFRTSYIEKAARNSLDTSVKDKILTLTGGHSKLTKIAFEKIVSEKTIPENIKSYLLEDEIIKKSLKQIWDALMPGEKIALKENLSFEQMKTSYPYLVKTGLVTEKGVSIPLFEEFIKNQEANTSSTINYNSEKNEVMKGEIPITSTLSASEVKLLRFIIKVTWSELKSQEGVTDQALDQIIYRLRKKIENDPKNPKFITTIKGTGYKFSS